MTRIIGVLDCPHCEGRGSVVVGGAAVECATCGGDGEIRCGDCQRGVFRAEPCVSCFDEVTKAMNEVAQ